MTSHWLCSKPVRGTYRQGIVVWLLCKCWATVIQALFVAMRGGNPSLRPQVGVVGGTIKNHPTAQAALAMLDVQGAQELGEIIAAVGLAQNLAALRALATEGIQRGHMSMHARSLVARVLPDASEEIRARVLSELIQTKDIKEARALEIHQALTAT